MSKTRKAILVVSFGTSFPDTCKKTIDVIEQRIGEHFSDYKIYRAWTSKMIMAKLLKRDNIRINHVTEAMEQMITDGIAEVIVQPTHVINGIENDLMKEDALAFKNRFERITFGDPLLTTQQDHVEIVNAICQEFSNLPADCALILMGHGTSHYANDVYAALDYRFKDLGFSNIHLATVEGYPTLENVTRMVKEQEAKKVILAPFMIVAGDHARNDMSGDDEDSWKNQFRAAGYDVECRMKGLGEYPAIQDMLIRHVTEVC